MQVESSDEQRRPRVLIIGGGFGGLAAAKRLARGAVQVTLVDRTNHHLFQPLLYQVATGGLSPANIAAPLRSVFRRRPSVWVVRDEIADIDLDARVALSATRRYAFDYVILATGGVTGYPGGASWADHAPGLKTLADATHLRHRLLRALEDAEARPDASPPPAVVIAGGGPTGVEMAGAVAELTRHTLRGEFRRVAVERTPILLIDPGTRLLDSYPAALSERARARLEEFGVDVRLGALLEDTTGKTATLRTGDQTEAIDPAVVIWAAGVRASPLAMRFNEALGQAPAPGGRVAVGRDLSPGGAERVFCIGDVAAVETGDGEPLPGVAPVAIQQGEHAAKNVLRRIGGRSAAPFRYRDYGSMAVIGRGAAVAEMGRIRLSGYPAWLAWLLVHLLQLVGHENRVLVAWQWAWSYFTRNRSARLIDVNAAADAD